MRLNKPLHVQCCLAGFGKTAQSAVRATRRPQGPPRLSKAGPRPSLPVHRQAWYRFLELINALFAHLREAQVEILQLLQAVQLLQSLVAD